MLRENLAAKYQKTDKTDVVMSSNVFSEMQASSHSVIKLFILTSWLKSKFQIHSPEWFWIPKGILILTERLVVFGTYWSCSPSSTSITGCLPFFMIISCRLSCTTGLQKGRHINFNVHRNQLLRTTVIKSCCGGHLQCRFL